MQVEISMSDVEQHSAWPSVKDHERGVIAVLYLMGLDLKKSYQSEVLTHRSLLTRETVTCERFVGTQRTDEKFKELLLMARAIPHRVTTYD